MGVSFQKTSLHGCGTVTQLCDSRNRWAAHLTAVRSGYANALVKPSPIATPRRSGRTPRPEQASGRGRRPPRTRPQQGSPHPGWRGRRLHRAGRQETGLEGTQGRGLSRAGTGTGLQSKRTVLERDAQVSEAPAVAGLPDPNTQHGSPRSGHRGAAPYRQTRGDGKQLRKGRGGKATWDQDAPGRHQSQRGTLRPARGFISLSQEAALPCKGGAEL